jgi:hypothetical protein
MITQRSIASDKQMFYALVAEPERRRQERRRKGILARAARIVGGREMGRIEVLISDVSATGVGLWSNIPLESGTVYRLQIFGESDLYVRVVRSRKRFDGSYDVGAKRCSAAFLQAA